MHKVVFINGQLDAVAGILSDKAPEGYAVSSISYRAAEAEKLQKIGDADFLVLHPAEISPTLLRAAAGLRLIQLLTAGYDRIDLRITQELGVPVATNGGANSWAVAEHCISLLLAIYKRLPQCDQAVRQGQWRKPITGFNTFEVAGKTVGLVGAGNVGRKVARRLGSFETRILYHDARPAPDLEQDLGARRVSLEELLREADIITIHVPLLPETRSLIGARELGLMKSNAVLLNTSRGQIIDEGALVAALAEKRIAAAGLDVFQEEPISPDNPLLKLDNVLLTPHSAGHSYEGWFRRCQFAWENIQRTAAGQSPLSLAVPEVK